MSLLLLSLALLGPASLEVPLAAGPLAPVETAASVAVADHPWAVVGVGIVHRVDPAPAERLRVDPIGVPLPPAGALEVQAASALDLRWSQRGSLWVEGPADLRWDGVPSAAAPLVLGDFARADVEVRGEPMGLLLAGAFLLEVSGGVVQLEQRSGGGVRVLNSGASSVRVRGPGSGRPWERELGIGERVDLDLAAALAAHEARVRELRLRREAWEAEHLRVRVEVATRRVSAAGAAAPSAPSSGPAASTLAPRSPGGALRPEPLPDDLVPPVGAPGKSFRSPPPAVLGPLPPVPDPGSPPGATDSDAIAPLSELLQGLVDGAAR